MARYFQNYTLISQVAGANIAVTTVIPDMDGADGIEVACYFSSAVAGAACVQPQLIKNIGGTTITVAMAVSVPGIGAFVTNMLYVGPVRGLSLLVGTDTAAGTGALTVTVQYKGA